MTIFYCFNIKIATAFITMKNYFAIVLFFSIVFSDCSVINSIGADNIKRELVDLNTFKIEKVAKSAAYGYTSQEPIKVGGVGENRGMLNSRRFLNALRGPNGEKVTYELKGSCCYHQLPESSTSKIGLLDRYEVNVGESTYLLFLSTFEEAEELYLPKGFSFMSI